MHTGRIRRHHDRHHHEESPRVWGEIQSFERFLDEAAELGSALLPFDGLVIFAASPMSELRFACGPFGAAELPWLVQDDGTADRIRGIEAGAILVRSLDDPGDEPAGPWSAFEDRARLIGVTSYAVFPIGPGHPGGGTVGALLVLSRATEDLASPELDAAARLAELVGITSARHLAMIDDARRIDDFEHRLQSNAVVDQAQGFLAGRLGTSLATAHGVLRTQARERGMSLAEAARGVITGTIVVSAGATEARPLGVLR